VHVQRPGDRRRPRHPEREGPVEQTSHGASVTQERCKLKKSASSRTELDSAHEPPGILRLLLKVRSVRVGVAFGVVVAVLALSVLPAAHLHRLASGQTMVHSHVLDAAEDHQNTLDHGDHHAAQTLSAVFTVERGVYSFVALTVAVVLLPVPQPQSFAYAPALVDPVIHGPPIRALSPRGPPA
jgi:hypothetical protein